MGFKYFAAGIGFASIINYQYMKKYQEKTERDLNILLKEHKSVVDQVIAKSQLQEEEKWKQFFDHARKYLQRMYVV